MNVFATDGEVAEKLDELPPSAKLVFKVLEYNGQMTQKELAEETRLSVRTVRYALNRLKEQELVTKVPCLDDGRRTFYDLNDGEEEGVEEKVGVETAD
ncbi:MAG: helix-turn-helix domain-containing protein [Halobacteria archaeon]|nr:helix-turn-helix domain-containing protein [Halobacteria archaeon]